MRLVLLGDSIIDNGSYVSAGEPDVAAQVRASMPTIEVVMRAVDGAVVSDVQSQLDGLQADDVIVLSAGGNDALGNVEVLDGSIKTTSRDVLLRLFEVRMAFAERYNRLITALRAKHARVIVMTIYNPKFSAHGMSLAEEQAAEAALSLFNDVIQRTALSQGCDILDIRPLFTDGDDFANPIEPSAKGGAKLAAAITALIQK